MVEPGFSEEKRRESANTTPQGVGANPRFDEPAEGTALTLAALKTLADPHNTDYEAIGLADFGRPGNYMLRQISRWTKQYKASETQHLDTVERLIEWLPATVPADDQTTIVHADYRLDNEIMHP